MKIIGRQSSAADLVQCPEANINTQQLPTFADAQITWHATWEHATWNATWEDLSCHMHLLLPHAGTHAWAPYLQNAWVKIPSPRKYRWPLNNGIWRYLCDHIGKGGTMSHNQALSNPSKAYWPTHQPHCQLRHIYAGQKVCPASHTGPGVHINDWHTLWM